MFQIQWLGQSAFVLDSDGHRLLTDPWIRKNPVCRTPLEDLLDAESIIVSHGHFDHFGDTIELMDRSQAMLAVDPEISWYMSRYGYERNKRLFPVAQGGAVQLGKNRVTAVPAIHPSAIYGEEWQTEKRWLPNASALSFIIENPDAPTVYFAGDTALFSDMQLFARRYKPEIALLPIGGRFTMDALDAEEAVGFLGCRYVIPCHYNTNPELIADAEAFRTKVEARYPGVKVIVLAPGESYQFS